ncbi:MAG TPA: PEP-CTERM sorting domain-containing protein [Tepidisphaeraceae bacterium]|jgi:hypothetical protein|nr:PEP-CTERM sorting domain-containing protein [Tepidisphaeraceae bacterium]
MRPLRISFSLSCGLLALAAAAEVARADGWQGYAGNAQHTAISLTPADSLQTINWSTNVDLSLPHPTVGDVYVHYGSPMITPGNTVIVPVRQADGASFQIDAFNGSTGAAKWSLSTDYTLPSSSWVPPYSPTLTPSGRLYYPGNGGTLYYRDSTDSSSGATGQLAFYGATSYYQANAANFNADVKISTPLTSDPAGNVYFGFQATGGLKDSTGNVLQSGIAKITPTGAATWVATPSPVSLNAALAISNNGNSVYALTTDHLVQFNTSNLATVASTTLTDLNGNTWAPTDVSTASPMVGPDGDVYVGTLNGPQFNNDRGWLLHFSGDLATAKAPGAFGWDSTPSVVPASVVAKMKAAGTYSGSASYLLMCKYNNYADFGIGDGQNKLAILDPTSLHTDPATGYQAMKEVMTITGVTPDPSFPNTPGAVREWCINTAAVDAADCTVLANSEDGRLYCWNLLTNTFTQSITLNSATGEAYTPTEIGPDGTVYATNDGFLYAVTPEPGGLALVGCGLAGFVARRRRR